jgi:hypothetical protein
MPDMRPTKACLTLSISLSLGKNSSAEVDVEDGLSI